MIGMIKRFLRWRPRHEVSQEVIEGWPSNRLADEIRARATKQKIKVAVDESIGKDMASRIRAFGYEIVCVAGHAEPDNVWMKRAKDKGALFIISPDLDIPSIIERENYPMVWIDFLFAKEVYPTIDQELRDEKRKMWSQYVHDRIQAKTKFLNSVFRERV